MKLVAFDPGVTGGIAVFERGKLLDVCEMPVNDGRVDGAAIAAMLRRWEPDHVAIENTQPMPRNGSIASYSLGLNTGILIGIVQALSHPLVRVRPQQWKKAMGLRGKTKDASRQLATELYPLWAASFRLKRQDGLAEAVLIGRWCIGDLVQQANALYEEEEV